MKLNRIVLTTRTNEDMAVALPQVWRGLRLAGCSRVRVLAALATAWAKGDIRIDPAMPEAPKEPRILVGRPTSKTR